MALRDTSWITDSHAIVTQYRPTQDVIQMNTMTDATTFAVTTLRRTREVTVSKWIALTENAAKNYATAHAGDTDTTYDARQTHPILDAWELVKSVDTKTDWAQDT
jgi:hypothetical protein